MSVFTPLERHELEVFLAPYRLGRLRDFQGIAAGSENSNFFVSLEQGEFVLTLVERGPVADLPFFIELLDVTARCRPAGALRPAHARTARRCAAWREAGAAAAQAVRQACARSQRPSLSGSG